MKAEMKLLINKKKLFKALACAADMDIALQNIPQTDENLTVLVEGVLSKITEFLGAVINHDRYDEEREYLYAIFLAHSNLAEQLGIDLPLHMRGLMRH